MCSEPGRYLFVASIKAETGRKWLKVPPKGWNWGGWLKVSQKRLELEGMAESAL